MNTDGLALSSSSGMTGTYTRQPADGRQGAAVMCTAAWLRASALNEKTLGRCVIMGASNQRHSEPLTRRIDADLRTPSTRLRQRPPQICQYARLPVAASRARGTPRQGPYCLFGKLSRAFGDPCSRPLVAVQDCVTPPPSPWTSRVCASRPPTGRIEPSPPGRQTIDDEDMTSQLERDAVTVTTATIVALLLPPKMCACLPRSVRGR